jgi:hypothetical protein
MPENKTPKSTRSSAEMKEKKSYKVFGTIKLDPLRFQYRTKSSAIKVNTKRFLPKLQLFKPLQD